MKSASGKFAHPRVEPAVLLRVSPDTRRSSVCDGSQLHSRDLAIVSDRHGARFSVTLASAGGPLRDRGRPMLGHPMSTDLRAAVERYLRAKPLSRGTRNEYQSTLRKWDEWGHGVALEDLQRRDVREFL